MLQQRQIVRNGIVVIVQIVVNVAITFVLYRFFLRTIGIENFGIWSLILGTMAVARIGDLGLSASTVKLVAKYVARDEDKKACNAIQTAAITIALSVTMFLAIMYLFRVQIFSHFVTGPKLALALAALPYAFASFWITSVTGVINAGLTGYQRIDIRSVIQVGGTILNLFLCFWLVPTHGLIGIAGAQVIRGLLVSITNWFLLRRYLHELPIFPWHWKRLMFRELLGYGSNIQAIHVMGLLCEPVTKGLLAKFGSLDAVGYYEMASGMIGRFRSFLISINEVLIPTIADLHETAQTTISSVYAYSYQLMQYLAMPLFALIIGLTPSICELWIGHYQPTFVVFANLLSIGFFLNTLSIPANHTYMGIGYLRWNVLGSVAQGIANVGIGWVLGSFFRGTGVVAAWAFSMVLGGGIILVSYHVRYKVTLKELRLKQNISLMLGSAAATFGSLILYYKMRVLLNPASLIGTVAVLFLVTTGIPLWKHPMRHRLMGLVVNEVLRR